MSLPLCPRRGRGSLPRSAERNSLPVRGEHACAVRVPCKIGAEKTAVQTERIAHATRVPLSPDAGIGWQYTSKGRVPGITGNVDRDVFYKDYSAEEPSDKEKLNKIPKFVGKVTATVLNVRTGAGTEYPNLREYPILEQGNLIDVCDTRKAADGTTWYYIRIAGRYFGFVAARYIERQ